MEKVGEKIKIGICVLQKKVLAMEELLKRLESFGEFEIIRFGDKIILEDPVERWPLCDCLIAFYSTGFPLKKAEDYAALRQPFLINDLEQQHHLQDRRDVYKRLASCGVSVPRHAAVTREFPFQELPNFFEDEDYIKIDGNEFWKPFIEKPVDSEDHNIRIYYPRSAGGGMKELFRKVGDQSSSFHPDVNKVRRGGSFIYEDFLATGGKDIKVYTVGEDYAHAEARKSPVVDGKVIRSNDGKEVRFPILLRQREKEMARKVVSAFDQAVCGFDILRTERCSYVCDVNGWSFVKNSEKYYDDAVYMLRKMCLDAKAHILSTSISRLPCIAYDQPCGGQQTVHLRCMIAIIRHGDRTPKQKVKLEVTEENFLQLMIKYNGGSATSEAKLKTAMQLQEVLNVLKDLVQCPSGSDIITEVEHAEKLRQIQNVLEEGGCFSGINRKVQIKPSKWIKIAKGDGESEIEQPVEALMVVKYGGVLTGAGKKQAEELGRYFRNEMYPGDGLLRLHSMYQHELKIYSSSEGRVQMSAAGFAKGFLNLDGELTPILVSLVSRDYSILEGLNSARIEMAEAKAQLNNLIVYGERDDSAMELSNTPWMADGAGLPTNVSELLQKLVRLTKEVTEQVRLLVDDHSSAEVPCGKEGLFLMYARWRKFESDLYNERKKRFDISKIADLYDCCKYDLIHNAHLKLHGLLELFRVAQMLAAGVTSNEYGINPIQKLKIGTKIARRLVNKILRDLKNTRDETFDFGEFENQSDNSLCEDEDCFVPKYDVDTLPQVRTRLYFTSESHIHSLLNVLRYANLHESLRGEDGLVSFSGLEHLYKTKELDFMSGIVLRMFEDSAVPSEDPRRFRVEMSFTRGADSSLLEKDEEIREHRLPIVGLESLQEVGSYLTLEHLETILANAVKTEEQPKEQKSKKRGHLVTNE